MEFKEIILALGIFICVVKVAIYLKDILRLKTKPHVFSWLIWSLVTGIAFLGQKSNQAGLGSYITIIDSGFCFLTCLLALKYGEKNITRSDCVIFLVALSAIPLWVLTKTPLYSMFLVTIIDTLGFYPSFRKSWDKPHEETASNFFLSGTMCLCGLLALENYTVITVVYPFVLLAFNMLFTIYLFWRRRTVKDFS